MDHLPIVKSLARVAIAQGEKAGEQQVRRLAAALRSAGDPDAVAMEKLLEGVSNRQALVPSRLVKSAAGLGAPETMPRGVAVPVDRETSVPLARVIFPGDVAAPFPVLRADVAAPVDSLLREWERREELMASGLAPSMSALFYGPPGTGKTTLALALAERMGLPAVVAQLDGLISSFLGTTARNLGALFSFADRFECVLVLDEFDAMAKVRDDPNEVGEIKRVVNTLLQNIDARQERGITIGLTNHEALLDRAVWRRFDVQVALPLPTAKERLQIVSSAWPNEGTDPTAGSEVKLLAWISEGLSGAELVTLCRKARKSKILGTTPAAEPPVQAFSRMVSTTSLMTDPSRTSPAGDLSDALLQRMARANDVRFSKTELAYLFAVSSKTVSRRLSNEHQKESSDGE